jgi:hypothetical protein
VPAEQSGPPSVVTGGFGAGDGEFELTVTTAGGAGQSVPGPFVLRGSNIHYDDAAGALVVDLTVTNVGQVWHPLPVWLTFVSLMPEGVTVLNPDNDEHGPGAAIQFHFTDKDTRWSPGETSIPRTVEFGVDQGVSIGFAVRIDVGTEPPRGAIGGVAWHDENEDGVRDDGEPGLGGRTIILHGGPDMPWETVVEIERRTETAEDGSYRFDELLPGLYTVMWLRDRCTIPTTPTEMQVVLVEENGKVADFLEADFGLVPIRDCGGGGLINGDFSLGETGWTNDSEGPGLDSGVQEIIDVDGRQHVLHLDSRAGGNYYLFRSQMFGVENVTGHVLSWNWKLASIESDYGLAAVWVDFFADGEIVARYYVRRHTGEFSEYTCSSMLDDAMTDYPAIGLGCEEVIGTSQDWTSSSVAFGGGFFDGLAGPAVDPSTIDAIKVWIQSYNNAGAGVDAYFDDFVYTSQ